MCNAGKGLCSLMLMGKTHNHQSGDIFGRPMLQQASPGSTEGCKTVEICDFSLETTLQVLEENAQVTIKLLIKHK